MTNLPARSTIQTFDGDTKVNDQNNPPAIQSLQWDNPSLGRAVSDVAALGLTGTRVWLRITLASTTGGLVIPVWWANWSNIQPVIQPIPTRLSQGSFTVTLPTTVLDEYDVSVNQPVPIPLILLSVTGSLEGVPGAVSCSANANIITINTFNVTGSPNDFAGQTILVVAR